MIGNKKQSVVLQDRDRTLLEALKLLRFVDRPQASEAAGFNSASRAKQRLLALVRGGYLGQTFVGTIHGGRKAIYCLPKTISQRPRDRSLIGARHELFIEHQLAINAVYFAARRESAPTGLMLRRWEHFRSPIVAQSGVVPDAYAEVSKVGGETVASAFCLEVDLETESLPVWSKKIDRYLALARSGLFLERFGIPTFRVLVVAQTEHRISAIRSLIARSTDRVFYVATTKSIENEGFWSAVWQKPSSDQKYSLL